MDKKSETGTTLALCNVKSNFSGSIWPAEESKLLYAFVWERFDKAGDHSTTEERLYGVHGKAQHAPKSAAHQS
jgi:hypothetical protein